MSIEKEIDAFLKCLRKQLKLDGTKLRKSGSGYLITNKYGDNFILGYFEELDGKYFLDAVLGDRPPCQQRDIEEAKIESHICHCLNILKSSVFINS